MPLLVPTQIISDLTGEIAKVLIAVRSGGLTVASSSFVFGFWGLASTCCWLSVFACSAALPGRFVRSGLTRFHVAPLSVVSRRNCDPRYNAWGFCGENASGGFTGMR